MKFYFQAPVIAVSAMVLLAGCTEEMDSHSHPELTTGKQLFEHHCASCHGDAGEGRFLAGVPATSNTRLDKYQLIRWLKNVEGKPRAAPSFPMMGDPEAEKIVNYLLMLNNTG